MLRWYKPRADWFGSRLRRSLQLAVVERHQLLRQNGRPAQRAFGLFAHPPAHAHPAEHVPARRRRRRVLRSEAQRACTRRGQTRPAVAAVVAAAATELAGRGGRASSRTAHRPTQLLRRRRLIVQQQHCVPAASSSCAASGGGLASVAPDARTPCACRRHGTRDAHLQQQQPAKRAVRRRACCRPRRAVRARVPHTRQPVSQRVVRSVHVEHCQVCARCGRKCRLQQRGPRGC
eukprot:365075-Chlamydomonas_euryale.AAC.14